MSINPVLEGLLDLRAVSVSEVLARYEGRRRVYPGRLCRSPNPPLNQREWAGAEEIA